MVLPRSFFDFFNLFVVFFFSKSRRRKHSFCSKDAQDSFFFSCLVFKVLKWGVKRPWFLAIAHRRSTILGFFISGEGLRRFEERKSSFPLFSFKNKKTLSHIFLSFFLFFEYEALIFLEDEVAECFQTFRNGNLLFFKP